MEIGKDLLRSRELRKAPQASTDIRPEDSVSNVGSQDGSRLSTRSRASSRSSTRSSSSAKVKAAARRAVLEAEAAALERLYAIQEEELRLQQRKKQLELQTCIDKAEAKEMAYAEAEAQEMRNFYVIDQTGEDIEGVLDPLATSTIDARPQSNATKRNEAQSAATKPNQSYTPRNKNETPQLRAQMLNADAAEWTYNTSNSIPPDSMNGDIIAKMLDSQDRQSHALHQLLKQQQENVMALTLPQPDLPVFDGDAIQYCDFIRAFENLIERKTSSSSARLYYLVQYTSGQVQQLMRSCLSMKEDEGYREARKLLLERYGQAYKIATAFVDRIANGPPIKAEDGPGLQKFSILLTSCSNTLTEIGYISKLENPDGLRKIVDRLPFSLKLKWRELVDTTMQRENRDVTVKDITSFIETRARVANNPIFGKLSCEKRNDSAKNRKQHPSARNCATHGKLIPPGVANTKYVKCPLCDANHWLSQCDAFKKMNLDDRYKFVRMKKLCINCLIPGHFVRDCLKKSFCRVQDCTDKHSTFLHLKEHKTRPLLQKPEQNETSKFVSARTEVTEVSVGPVEGERESNNGFVRTMDSPQRVSKCTSTTTGLAVVPVKVKAKGSDKMIETYAFLDSGSNTSFCTETLTKRLNLEGTKMTLSLTTLESTNTPTESSFVNLEVFDLKEDNFVELRMVFSRPSLPISRESIADQSDVNR